mgnify:CR=1 FL=1
MAKMIAPRWRSYKGGQRDLRQGRFSEAGLYYFLTTGTKDRQPLFLHPPAAQIVLDTLKWLDHHGRITLVAAVVMPDHLHFVAQLKGSRLEAAPTSTKTKDGVPPKATTLSKLMHSLKSYTANKINKALGRRGQVWERQYYERGIRGDKALFETIRYCLENSVREGLVDDFRKYPYWYCMYDL